MRVALMFAATVGLISAAAVAEPKPKMDQSQNWDALMKLYPKRALAAREQGLVGFKITLDHTGQPTACEVTHTSGHPLLDNETCDLLLTHVTFQPPRDAAGNRLPSMTTTGVINWRMPGQQLVTEAVKVAAGDPLERKVCKRTPRTGSLAGFDRVCMTVREWDQSRRAATDNIEDARKQGFTSGN